MQASSAFDIEQQKLNAEDAEDAEDNNHNNHSNNVFSFLFLLSSAKTVLRARMVA